MCVVNITDFKNNPNKYFKIARNERVIIKDEQATFELAISKCKDGFITADQVLEGVSKHIKERFASK